MGVQIYGSNYERGSGSKANRVRAFWDAATEKQLRSFFTGLLEGWTIYSSAPKSNSAQTLFQQILSKLGGSVVKAAELGIVICGSGNGIAMSANRHPGIRCALCWTPEIASLARSHNDANILSLPARFIDEQVALSIVETFLLKDFEGGRHQRRVDKIEIA